MPSISEYERADEARERFARERGLPVAASWQEIRVHDAAQRLIRKLRRNRLPLTTTMEQFWEWEEQQKLQQKEKERQALAREFGLDEDSATLEDINKIRRALPSTDYPIDWQGEPITDDADLG